MPCVYLQKMEEVSLGMFEKYSRKQCAKSSGSHTCAQRIVAVCVCVCVYVCVFWAELPDGCYQCESDRQEAQRVFEVLFSIPEVRSAARKFVMLFHLSDSHMVG